MSSKVRSCEFCHKELCIVTRLWYPPNLQKTVVFYADTSKRTGRRQICSNCKTPLFGILKSGMFWTLMFIGIIYVFYIYKQHLLLQNIEINFDIFSCCIPKELVVTPGGWLGITRNIIVIVIKILISNLLELRKTIVSTTGKELLQTTLISGALSVQCLSKDLTWG